MFGSFGNTNNSAFGSFNQQPQSQSQSQFGFGQPQTTSFGFGQSQPFPQQQQSAFGQQQFNQQKPAFTQQTSDSANLGSGSPSYSATHERDSNTSTMNIYQHISAMSQYKNWSPEELRVQDYSMNKKYSTTNTAFPSSSSSSTTTTTFNQQPQSSFGFNQPTQQQPFASFPTTTTTPAFGTTNAFAPTPSPFGQTSAFGGQPAPSTPAFGQPTTTSAFGQPTPSPFGTQQSQFGFGQTTQPTQPTSIFGSQTPAFGTPATTTPSTGIFGKTATNPVPAFGFNSTPTTTPAFGQPQQSTGIFGTPQPSTGIFGQQQQQATTKPPSTLTFN
jgi:nuclear pore complex protein Nup98-Nup96